MGWQILEKRIGFLRHAPVLARRTTTFLILTLGPCGAQGADPFASNNGSVPNPAEYNGPLFALSHDYPDRLLQQPAAFPWQQATNNEKVSVANASAYANALKQHVSGDITRLLTDYASWKPSDGGWYLAYPVDCQSNASVIMDEGGSPRLSDDASSVSAGFPG
jgi:hypothetical protein